MKRLFIALMGIILSGCSGGGNSSSSSGSTSSLSGIVSAGPINGATVTAYSLNSNGSLGNQLATATSDSNGNYSLSIAAQSSPVIIIASGGSYVEEASGSTVSMGNAQVRTILSSTSDGQQVGVTAVTEISTQNILAAIAANGSASLSAIINSSNEQVASAMGLSNITVPPANPNQPASSSSSTQAAQYAVVLASISQMAMTASTTAGSTVNSLDMTQALAIDSSGNVYLTGLTTVAIDGETQHGVEDLFITKYNSSGSRQWTVQDGASGGSTNGEGVAIDSSGNIYATGPTTAAIDGQTQHGDQDMFITSYDSTGASR